jgi:hypothetical protein
MDRIDAETTQTPRPETEAGRQDRYAWEAERIADLDAGLYVDADEMRAWIDSLRTDVPLPPPPTRRL